MISDAEAPAPACRYRVDSDGEVADSGTLREPPKAPARCYAGCRSRHPAPPAMIELPEFAAARQLYGSLGFTPAPPVASNPVPGTAFLGRDL
ncbi:hypothetical protein ABIC50_001700 [Burkholderia sp. 567]